MFVQHGCFWTLFFMGETEHRGTVLFRSSTTPLPPPTTLPFDKEKRKPGLFQQSSPSHLLTLTRDKYPEGVAILDQGVLYVCRMKMREGDLYLAPVAPGPGHDLLATIACSAPGVEGGAGQ